MARRVASLSGRQGGLGLRSAVRTSSAAFWASWADALPVLLARSPEAAETMLRTLEAEVAPQGSGLSALLAARAVLVAEGFHGPPWRDLAAGVRPPRPQEGEDMAPWEQGWQFYACSFRETHFREHVVLPALDPSAAVAVGHGGGQLAQSASDGTGAVHDA